MNTVHAIWDPGWFAAMVIFSAITAIGIAVIISSIFWEVAEGVVVGAIVTVVAGAILIFVSFPWSGQYHRFVPVSGTITQPVTSRFIASDQSGGGSTQKFLVTVNGKPYGCNDTRCSALRPGQHVTLMCERAWQWSGIPGWDCNWG